MSRPPYPEKPKPRNGIPLTTFLLLGFMVVLGVLIGGSAMLAAAPTLFNHRATLVYLNTLESSVMEREYGLSATQVELEVLRGSMDGLATSQALNLMATELALQNNEALLQQTATQSQNFVQATATANAAFTSRQLTQVALDYAATQSQLNQNATDVALNFDATLAAFGLTPEAAVPQSQSFSVLPSNTATPNRVQAATASPAPSMLPFDNSPTPRPVATPIIEAFTQGIPSTRWLSSGSADWSQSQRGVVSQDSSAWILGRIGASSHVVIRWEPAIASPASYRFTLIGQNGENWYLQLDTEALRVVRAVLYRFDGGLPIAGVGEMLSEAPVNLPLEGLNTLTLNMTGLFEARLNDQPILILEGRTLPEAPTVGVQFPSGAMLSTIRLNQEPDS